MARKLLTNAQIVPESGKPRKGWLLTSGEFIEAMGWGAPLNVEADEVIDLDGDLLLPGMIDAHVHFREPGLTHKGTMATESGAAVAGGVTSFMEMPNCSPATVTVEAWEQKMALAAEASLANYAFYIGATNSNLDSELLRVDYTRVPGVKLFLGSSTGNLLVDSEPALERLFAEVKVPIAVHAEDNERIKAHTAIAREVFGGEEVPVECHPLIRDSRACLDATLHALALAAKHNAQLHLLHVSTAIETKLLRAYKPQGVTAETCIQYLQFSDADYEALGTRIKCNPAIKGATDRTALRKAVKEGIIDTVGSDHAPHLLSEKQGDALTAPSGTPEIQFQLPLLLDLYAPEVVARVAAAKPAEIFQVDRRGALKPGNYADMVRIRKEPHTITDAEVLSLCGWTPMDGVETGHRVITTWVNGSEAYTNGKITDKKTAKALKFNRK